MVKLFLSGRRMLPMIMVAFAAISFSAPFTSAVNGRTLEESLLEPAAVSIRGGKDVALAGIENDDANMMAKFDGDDSNHDDTAWDDMEQHVRNEEGVGGPGEDKEQAKEVMSEHQQGQQKRRRKLNRVEACQNDLQQCEDDLEAAKVIRDAVDADLRACNQALTRCGNSVANLEESRDNLRVKIEECEAREQVCEANLAECESTLRRNLHSRWGYNAINKTMTTAAAAERKIFSPLLRDEDDNEEEEPQEEGNSINTGRMRTRRNQNAALTQCQEDRSACRKSLSNVNQAAENKQTKLDTCNIDLGKCQNRENNVRNGRDNSRNKLDKCEDRERQCELDLRDCENTPRVPSEACSSYGSKFFSLRKSEDFCDVTLKKNTAYVLEKDIRCSNLNGPKLASNACLDCRGFKIIGRGSEAKRGIFIPEASTEGVQVHNCVVEGSFNKALVIKSDRGATVSNVRLANDYADKNWIGIEDEGSRNKIECSVVNQNIPRVYSLENNLGCLMENLYYCPRNFDYSTVNSVSSCTETESSVTDILSGNDALSFRFYKTIVTSRNIYFDGNTYGKSKRSNVYSCDADSNAPEDFFHFLMYALSSVDIPASCVESDDAESLPSSVPSACSASACPNGVGNYVP